MEQCNECNAEQTRLYKERGGACRQIVCWHNILKESQEVMEKEKEEEEILSIHISEQQIEVTSRPSKDKSRKRKAEKEKKDGSNSNRYKKANIEPEQTPCNLVKRYSHNGLLGRRRVDI